MNPKNSSYIFIYVYAIVNLVEKIDISNAFI